MSSDAEHVGLGYRIEESGAADDRGWYYFPAGVDEKVAEKTGPFESYAEALSHLEEELYGDDES